MKHAAVLIVAGLVLDCTVSAWGQSRPPRTIAVQQTSRPKTVRDYSWIYIEPPEPREIKLHDIVFILVDEKSEVTVNSRFNRQRNTTLKTELNEFIRLNEAGNLTNAADNKPTIDLKSTGRINSTGQVTDQEGIRLRIAATVVDVLPNGNVVLEGRKSIVVTQDAWEISLTGIVRSVDIASNNTVRSENIANFRLRKRQQGKVYASTKRSWGVALYDLLSPF